MHRQSRLFGNGSPAKSEPALDFEIGLNNLRNLAKYQIIAYLSERCRDYFHWDIHCSSGQVLQNISSKNEKNYV